MFIFIEGDGFNMVKISWEMNSIPLFVLFLIFVELLYELLNSKFFFSSEYLMFFLELLLSVLCEVVV